MDYTKFYESCLKYIILHIQVVLDGNFIFTALKYKLDIRHRVETLLQESNIKLFILKSVLDELRNVGDKASSALAWAQECCEILDDSRLSDTSTPLDRLKSVLGT